MTTNQSLKNVAGTLGGILVSFVLVANAQAAATPLATEPFLSSSAKVKALPNIMFVLDDSGSMNRNYLPDWAGPYLDTDNVTVLTPAHRFYNGIYNGVAYNPGTRYRPPSMYDNTGALDTTTYPGQTGVSVATGGDGSATALLPNWRAVKVDGYGVQSTATANLEGNAFSYTTVAGEYCDTAQLRNCVASATATGSYTFPAKLRWCTTAALAVGTTVAANGFCQASNIDDTATNIANGVTPYIYPRIPRPSTATITVTAGTVSGITVGGLQILSAGAASAAAVATNINACTLTSTGACTVVGYSAVSLGTVVTITAPNGTTATMVPTGGTTSAITAFSNGNVPGSSLYTVITPSVTSYVYPGTAAKGANRTDCADATYCTYAEEMTNYANWHAFYRTRMEMMKTSASIAFSNVTDQYRVGYYSINNGRYNHDSLYKQFLNVSAFDGAQKYSWYSTFLNAYPFGATPLRTSLAATGQMYAGKKATMNLTSVVDPVEYSCQQNYTILSTDGYWYGEGNPSRIDGTTEIGQQDGNLDRPYYDGATQTRTLSQTTMAEQQIGMNTFLVESMTRQQQTTTSRLTETVVTTDTYPWTTQTTTLQTQTTPLNQTAYSVRQRTYPLTSVTKELQASTYTLNSTPRILQSYINNLTKTITPLEARTYNVTRATKLVTKKDYNVTRATKLVTKKDYNVTRSTKLVTQKVYNVTRSTKLVTQKVYNVTRTTSALQSSTYKIQSSSRQLQKSMEVSSDGGDTWVPTGWVNASSCTTAASGPGYTRNTTCRYNTAVVAGNLNSCTNVAASPSSPYTVAVAVTCAYEVTPTVAAVGSCTVVAQSGSFAAPQVACGYSGTPVVLANQTTCTALDQTGSGTMTGDKVACTYDATPTTTTGLATCSWVVPSPSASSTKTECSYGSATTLANQTTCAATATASAVTNGSVWNTDVDCSYDATPTTTTGLATCSWVVPSPSASATKTECSYGSVTNLTNQTTCTAAAAASATTNGSVWNTNVACSYDGTPTTTTGLATCSWVVPSPSASSTKTECSYGSTTTLANQTTCAATPTASAVTDGSVWNTDVDCSYDAAAASTLTSQSSCTWVVPSPAASVPRTDCSYNAGAATPSTVATCTPVAQSTGSTNGTVWSGPATACVYAAAVLTGTNLATCTAGAASGGAPFLAYTSCGYINGTTTTGLNSCTYLADSTGPVNYTGPKNACAYTGTAVVTNVGTCTPVAQSGTFAAPQVTCAYQATGTPASNLTSCTDVPQSGGSPYSGPNVACAYSSSTSADSTVASCTVHDSGGSPYTGGARVRCTYNSGAVSSNVASCNVVTKSVSTADTTVYPTAYDCDYGSTTGWANATVACVPVAQSGGASKVGPARNCQYTTPSVDTFTATCAVAAEDNTNLTARGCLAGAFPVTVSTVATTVDTCSTAPTSSGSPVVRSTATSCVYQAGVTTDTPTCVVAPAPGVSPFTTEVACSVTNAGLTYVAVAPSCTPAGAMPATFDGTGKIVVCQTTEPAPSLPGTGTAAAPEPVASCTAGTDAGTKVQTNCQLLINTGPDPVQTCTNAAAAAGNTYVTTTCVTTSTPTTVMGCVASASTSPLWQTVTCVDDGSGTQNTLADTAAYYYKTDLRTFALSNCTAASGEVLCSSADDALPLTAASPSDPVSAYNNVPTSASDLNKFQHMVTFTLGLGASGYMKFSDLYATDTTGDYPTVKGNSPYAPSNGIAADPGNGICSWQATGNCNWPFPAENEQTTIDDLWHAGVNGHGAYFSATDPVSLSTSITSVLNSVAATGGATAAPAISNASLSPGDNFLWSSTYTSLDWTGELTRRQLDPYTGAVSSTVDWAVQAKLDAKVASTRSIYTFDSSVASTKLKAFTTANFAANAYFLTPNISTAPNGLTQFLCASTDICLSATNQGTAYAAGANLVDYLRGDRTHEGAETDNTKYYRQRAHVLGDMVNAQAVYVNVPNRSYADPGYGEFVDALTTTPRQAAVYAGANDGMLHAFAAKGSSATEAAVTAAAVASSAYALDPLNASLATAAASTAATAAGALAADTVVGQELWAFIPTAVLPNLYKLADKRYRDQHRYYVDATPAVGDICTASLANCAVAGTAVWKTILVGGLARGGRGYYALDVTDPASPKALWEFTDDNLGYTYGNPQIAKMSDGTWVVLVASGYNNIPNEGGAAGDGVGRLFVLNATTGVLIRSISTGVGSASDPSGLVKITAQVVNPTSDATVEAVYGGDMLGNLWRFDINNTVGATGYDAQLLAVLKDGSGNVQPITTKPQVGLEPKNGVKVVYVGTGRFLDPADVTDVSQQSFYAIKDVRATGTTPATAIFDNPGDAPRASAGVTSSQGFVRQVQTSITCPVGTLASICASGETIITSTNYPVDFVSDSGWVVDLIHSAERNNTNPGLDRSTVVFHTNAPSLAACDIGGTGYGYFLNYLTGGPNYSPGNGDPALNNGLVGKSFGNTFVSDPTLVITKSGQMIDIYSKSDGTIGGFIPPRSLDSGATRRTSWRELIRE